MKSLTIECVDDGCEGFYRATVDGKVLEFQCLCDLYYKLLLNEGYTFTFNSTEE